MEYVFNVNGKTYIANKGGEAYVANRTIQAYTKGEMAAFLSENVGITGWDDAGDGTNVKVYFTPITDQRALKYLEERTDNDGDMAFFQLLRHKPHDRRKASAAENVRLPAPTDLIRQGDAAHRNADGEYYGDYLKAQLEGGFYDTHQAADWPIKDYDNTAINLESTSSKLLGFVRTNGYNKAAAAKHADMKAWIRLDADSAKAGEISLP